MGVLIVHDVLGEAETVWRRLYGHDSVQMQEAGFGAGAVGDGDAPDVGTGSGAGVSVSAGPSVGIGCDTMTRALRVIKPVARSIALRTCILTTATSVFLIVRFGLTDGTALDMVRF